MQPHCPSHLNVELEWVLTKVHTHHLALAARRKRRDHQSVQGSGKLKAGYRQYAQHFSLPNLHCSCCSTACTVRATPSSSPLPAPSLSPLAPPSPFPCWFPFPPLPVQAQGGEQLALDVAEGGAQPIAVLAAWEDTGSTGLACTLPIGNAKSDTSQDLLRSIAHQHLYSSAGLCISKRNSREEDLLLG